MKLNDYTKRVVMSEKRIFELLLIVEICRAGDAHEPERYMK